MSRHQMSYITTPNISYHFTTSLVLYHNTKCLMSRHQMSYITTPKISYHFTTSLVLYHNTKCLMSQPQMSDKGWLRLVASFKLHVSFVEYRLFYRALLQKRPIIVRRLLAEATLYPLSDCLISFQYLKDIDPIPDSSFASETYNCKESTDRSHPI